MLSAAHSHPPFFQPSTDAHRPPQQPTHPPHDVNSERKRKAADAAIPQDNERLSKRLSLLNIEKDGGKLYVPVESPSDAMQVDDTKHKVYIHSIDDELADDDAPSPISSSELVFLSDMERHLRQTRVPALFMPKEDSDTDQKQMVLYTDPKSITVPEDKDSVRKAIVEARRRMREKQKERRDQEVHEKPAAVAEEPMELD